MKRWRAILISLLVPLIARPALAAPWPGDGSEMIMADWLFFSFLTFFGVALAAFIFAWRSGMFKNIEEAKYYILTIDEPDYYTPDWAREEEAIGTERSNGQPLSQGHKASEEQEETP